MTSTVDTAFKVSRTIKRTELRAFLCVLGWVGSFTPHVKNRMKCVGPQVKDDDLWSMIWDYKHRIDQEGCYEKSNTSRRIAPRKKKGSVAFRTFCYGRQCEDGRDGKKWSNVGWTRDVSDEDKQSSSEKSRPLPDFAIHSKLLLFREGVTRL